MEQERPAASVRSLACLQAMQLVFIGFVASRHNLQLADPPPYAPSGRARVTVFGGFESRPAGSAASSEARLEQALVRWACVTRHAQQAHRTRRELPILTFTVTASRLERVPLDVTTPGKYDPCRHETQTDMGCQTTHSNPVHCANDMI